MRDRFQALARARIREHDAPERLAIEPSLGVEHFGTECFDDLA